MRPPLSPAVKAALHAVEVNAALAQALAPNDDRDFTDFEAMNAALTAVRVMQPLTKGV